MGLSVQKKIIIYILVAVVVATVLGLVGFRMWVLRGGAEMYAGEVAKINENGFVLKDRKGDEIKIIIEPDTKILKGRKDVQEIPLISERVFVVGAPNEQNEIKARVIRVFKYK